MSAAPASRATRLRLERRLSTAARAIGVLEEKAHALMLEHRRLRQHAEETRVRWEAACRDADRWFLRAGVLGGPPQVELAVAHLTGHHVDVQVTWRSIMGATYPAQARVADSPAETVGSLARSSALAEAADHYRRAVAAGLDHAAAARALDVVATELSVTRHRLRALENRWVPRLRDRLRTVELALTAQEQEDMVRARWAAGPGSGR